MAEEQKYYIKEIRVAADGITRLIKASADGSGNDIIETYATKAELQSIMPIWPASANGTYILRATVANGVAQYSWILDTTLKTTEPDV